MDLSTDANIGSCEYLHIDSSVNGIKWKRPLLLATSGSKLKTTIFYLLIRTALQKSVGLSGEKVSTTE